MLQEVIQKVVDGKMSPELWGLFLVVEEAGVSRTILKSLVEEGILAIIQWLIIL